MLNEAHWKAFAARIRQLAEDCRKVQFQSPDALPRHNKRIAVGQYPSHLDFSLFDDPAEYRALHKDSMEANGSTFMGLWFLSGAVPLLRQLREQVGIDVIAASDCGCDGPDGVATSGVAAADVASIQGLLAAAEASCLAQLETAKQLPKFYQGGADDAGTRDIHQCPRYTMGWYPLLGRYRLPAVIPDWLEVSMAISERFSRMTTRANMSNITDGDVWSWCMAIDDTTPGIFEYFGEDTLRSHEIYKPLLGSFLQQSYMSLRPAAWLGTASIELLQLSPEEVPTGHVMASWLGDETLAILEEAPTLDASRLFPMQTFYCPDKGPKGAFSCAVMSNILAGIPTLGQPPKEYLPDLEAAALFVRTNARRALQEKISWRLYAYDYFTIKAAPVGYLLRAHRMIEELRVRKKLQSYPTLLDRETLLLCAGFVRRLAWGILSKHPDVILACDKGPGPFEGNEDYANLIYCFLSIMNLAVVAPDIYESHFRPAEQPPERQLVHRVAHFLLQPSDDVYDTPGTGPYRVFGVGPLSVYATKSSICFVLPPLLEAYSMYLLAELAESATPAA